MRAIECQAGEHVLIVKYTRGRLGVLGWQWNQGLGCFPHGVVSSLDVQGFDGYL